MNASDFATALFALMAVIMLILGLAWLMQRFGLLHQFAGKRGAGAARRLEVVETLPLDARRRMMIIRRDDQEHLIVLGQNGETELGAAWPAGQNMDGSARSGGDSTPETAKFSDNLEN